MGVGGRWACLFCGGGSVDVSINYEVLVELELAGSCSDYDQDDYLVTWCLLRHPLESQFSFQED